MTEQATQPMARATLGPEGYRVEIETGDRVIVADEPASVGGTETGPGPFELLYSSLAACVLMTIRMYTARKGWPLEGAELRVFPARKAHAPLDSIRLELTLRGDDLTEEQRGRILEIAGRCPIHRTLEKPLEIETALA